MEIVYLFSGLLVGGLLGWLFFKTKYGSILNQPPMDTTQLSEDLNSVRAELLVAGERISGKEKQLESALKELSENEQEIIKLNASLAQKESDHRHLLEKLESQKQELEAIREKFTVEFRNLANDILEEKSKKFTEQNRTQLDQLLKPLGEKIRDFEQKVEKAYQEESNQRFSLKEEVKRLAELNQTVSQEAHNLTRALKGQVKTQGSWGEMILENILERSGLQKDREYRVQPGYTTEDGRRLQPDVVLTYPGNKNVVVDAKVSLNAWERFVSADEDVLREKELKAHLISVKKHIDELAAKNYQHLYCLNSLDFVMMFMPVEPAFMTALQHDSNIWSYAYERGILIIGPTNLIAALKMVASLWQQEYQSRNVLEIADQSGKLYDKFVGFVEDLQGVGQKIQATQETYDRALNKLCTGRGNLVTRVEKIRKLGARATKELPNMLLESTEDEE